MPIEQLGVRARGGRAFELDALRDLAVIRRHLHLPCPQARPMPDIWLITSGHQAVCLFSYFADTCFQCT